MSVQLITAPAIEPVTLDEARAHLRVDFLDDDSLIVALISAARLHAEMLTGRSFITTRWKSVLDSFPGPSLMGVPFGASFTLPLHAILLHKCPVASIVSIQYLDMAGTLQTMPSSDYTADLACEPARITPVFGKIWPISLPQIGAVQITFDAGYGETADTVPAGIRHWIKLRLGSLYEHREEVALMSRGKIEPLPFVDGLLDPYRVVSF
jgi:uncharacterized phiE125 gp8 family phage protein